MTKTRIPKVMLDSGAYSVHTRGLVIDVHEYGQYARHLVDCGVVDYVINLDVIPGTPGVMPTARDIASACKQGWKNYEILTQEYGIPVIPVYHSTDTPDNFDRILDEKIPYMALGGIVGGPAKRRKSFFDHVFSNVTNYRGEPTVKVHGLGIGSIRAIMGYPWTSVDSSTSIKTSAHGVVRLPSNKHIMLSQNRRVANGDAYNDFRFCNLSVQEQQEIKELIEGFGFTIEELQSSTISRIQCQSRIIFSKCQTKKPFTNRSVFIQMREDQPVIPDWEPPVIYQVPGHVITHDMHERLVGDEDRHRYGLLLSYADWKPCGFASPRWKSTLGSHKVKRLKIEGRSTE